jgi:hypothetical protein
MNPPEIIDRLAKERAKGAASLLISWQQALAMLPPLPATQLRRIALACESPAATRQLARFLARESDPQAAIQALLETVDASDESLASWLSALATFADFLDGTPQRPPLRQALGYLHCCEVMIQSGPRYESFAATVQTLLNTYGYEGDPAITD